MSTNDGIAQPSSGYNYSIAFMKAFMSFFVVCCHCWDPDNTDFYPVSLMLRMCSAAVPIFIIISFYLSAKTFSSGNVKKTAYRFIRLLYPYLVWPLIYYFGTKFISYLVYKLLHWPQGMNILINPEILLLQIRFGNSKVLCPQFWYIFEMIAITLIFTVLFYAVPRPALKIILAASAVLAVILQYSGINYSLFGELQYEVSFPLGRLAESYPYAVTGFFLYDSGILKKIKKNGRLTVIICSSMLILMLVIGMFKPIPSPSAGFHYEGLNLYFYSLAFFILCFLLPFEKLSPAVRTLITIPAKYSMGVFAIHYGLGTIWECLLRPWFGWNGFTLTEVIVVYALSLLISVAVGKIPFKPAKLLVE